MKRAIVRARGGRAEIGKLRVDIQGVVFDGYSRRGSGSGALVHDFRLLQASI